MRLYHRRISTAAARYEDPATIDAEIRHCGLRIEQLRRSYLQRSGLGDVADATTSEILASPMAADVAAFLRRAVATSEADPLLVALVSRGDTEAFWVQGGSAPRGCMLYAYRLDEGGPRAARSALARDLVRLRAAAHEPGAEHLYLAVLSPDLALVLAGNESWSGPTGVVGVESGDAGDDDPVRAGFAALVEGRPEAAMGLFEGAFDVAPGRLGVGLAAAVAALLAGDPVRAEFSARHVALSAPSSSTAAYLLALAWFAQGRFDEGTSLVNRPDPQGGGLSLLRALAAAARGRWVLARRESALARHYATDAEWFAVRASRALGRRAGLVLATRLVTGMAVVAAVVAGGWFPLAVALGPLLVAPAWLLERRFRGEARTALASAHYDGVRLCSTELLPRDVDLPARH